MMDIYSYSRKRSKRGYFMLLFIYLLFIFSRLLFEWGIGSIVSVRETYPNHYFESQLSSKKATNEFFRLSKQRIFVVRGLLLYRISSSDISLKKSLPKRGDIVLVEVPNIINARQGAIRRILKKAVNVLTAGIVYKQYSVAFRKIVAIPGDTISYNSREVLSVNGTARSTDRKIKDFTPLVDLPKEITLQSDNYFIVGNNHYELDDRQQGGTHIDDIIGMPLLFLGPYWGVITFQEE